jgi:hypothetical protein
MACSRNRLCLFPTSSRVNGGPSRVVGIYCCFLSVFRLFLGHTTHLRLTVLGVLHATYPTVTEAVLKALSLCENLYSFTWVDDTSALPTVFLSFLKILRGLPLRALTLRTYSDPGEDAWAFLNTIPNLQKVAIWCMNGPPRVLQGWAPLLGSTLTELELGVRTDRTDRGSANDAHF